MMVSGRTVLRTRYEVIPSMMDESTRAYAGTRKEKGRRGVYAEERLPEKKKEEASEEMMNPAERSLLGKYSLVSAYRAELVQ